MNLSGLFPLVQEATAYRDLLASVEQGTVPDQLGLHRGLGIISAARPYVAASLYQQLGRPILLLTSRAERAGHWIEQLGVWLDSDTIYPFPEPDALPYERVPWSRETVSDRLSALTELFRWDGKEGRPGASTRSYYPPLVVASGRAWMHKTLPVREFRLGVREYHRGKQIDLQKTLGLWVSIGYRPDTVVEEPGTFCRRGGLIDVYPPNLPYPVRIELFGDEIESLRAIDPTTQRSRMQIEHFSLAPATEALPRLAPAAAQRVLGGTDGNPALDLSRCHPPARAEYEQDLVALQQGTHFRGIEFYLPSFYTHPATILDYLPAGGLCLIDDWDALMASVIDVDSQAQTLQSDLIKAGELPEQLPEVATPYFGWEDLNQGMVSPAGAGLLVLGGRRGQEGPGPFSELFVHGDRYGGQLRRVLDGCQEMRDSGHRVVLATRQAARISELLEDRGITSVPVHDVGDVKRFPGDFEGAEVVVPLDRVDTPILAALPPGVSLVPQPRSHGS